jgi:hypothetical protein
MSGSSMSACASQGWVDERSDAPPLHSLAHVATPARRRTAQAEPYQSLTGWEMSATVAPYAEIRASASTNRL